MPAIKPLAYFALSNSFLLHYSTLTITIRPALQRRAWKKLEEPKVRSAVDKAVNRLSQKLGLPLIQGEDDVEVFLKGIQSGLQRIVEDYVP